MHYRTLGKTGLELSVLSFGASSLGAEFRSIDLDDAMRCVQVALDCGMNLIDTSPFYGRGQSEILLGHALAGIPRDSYYLSSKLGRYTASHFDFSARRVVESVDTSLERMRVEHLDILLCHDIEFVELSQIVNETLPAVRRLQSQGKVRFVGISGYPMKIFRDVAKQCELDVVLSYNHYTLQNQMLTGIVELLKTKGIGIMNAAPFSARLLTNAPLPVWHKATDRVRSICRQAADHCHKSGVDIARIALQYSIANTDLATCITGSANPSRVRQWAEWIEQPLDPRLLSEVLKILEPIHNWFYIEGKPENNDRR